MKKINLFKKIINFIDEHQKHKSAQPLGPADKLLNLPDAQEQAESYFDTVSIITRFAPPQDTEPILADLDISEIVYEHRSYRNDPQIEPFALLRSLKNDITRDFGQELVQLEQNMLGTLLITTEEEAARLKLQQKRTLADTLLSFPFQIHNAPGAGVEQFKVAKNFPFKNQPVLEAKGTAFVVAVNGDKALIATARHVIAALEEENFDLTKLRFVSGYFLNSDNNDQSINSKPQVFTFGKKVTMEGYNLHVMDVATDWAVLEIERKEGDGTFPQPLQLNGDVKCGDLAYCLGHGMGLPLKLAWDGMIFRPDSTKFMCKLQSYAGNSGSPVFNQNQEVIGLLAGQESEEYFFQNPTPGEPYRQIFPKVHLNAHRGAICCSINAVIAATKAWAHTHNN